jgi:hypothetical protein
MKRTEVDPTPKNSSPGPINRRLVPDNSSGFVYLDGLLITLTTPPPPVFLVRRPQTSVSIIVTPEISVQLESRAISSTL